MLELILIPITIAYFLAVCFLFLYGVNFYYLTGLAILTRRKAPKVKQLGPWPKVTVQLPIYNEMYVSERLVLAASKLDYPHHLLEIQVLDDSTDETVTVVKKVIERVKKRGVRIKYLHRKTRRGYKAGALRDGFRHSSGEFLAIFDADFIPPPDFLKKIVPHFQNPEVAFVQARWGHFNRNFSFLTLLQSLAIDAHFMVEQLGRSRAGFWFNFNGTSGVWRRKAIQDAGGWRAETLTEDLDLSYRAFLKGWKAIYLSDLEAPAELPVAFTAYRRQQHRWARGSMECAIRLLPQIWKSRFPLRIKIQSTFHLTGYVIHLLLFVNSLLYPLIIILSQRYPALDPLMGLTFVLSLTALAPTLLFIVAQGSLGRRWWLGLPVLLFISTFGMGMMLNTLRAALEIATGKPLEFRRTPKFGVKDKTRAWEKQKYQLELDSIVYWELFFALLNVGTIVIAIRYNHLLIAVYAGLFAFGLAFTSLYTILQTIQIQRVQMRVAATSP
jgi:cellulose synthase/poly-beta-1,6-N-acetylglucosamine synthase-like glycosyltransferase